MQEKNIQTDKIADDVWWAGIKTVLEGCNYEIEVTMQGKTEEEAINKLKKFLEYD